MSRNLGVIRLQVLLISGLVAATTLMVPQKAEGQATASPTFNASTVGTTTTLTISDSTPGASIYYATGGRTATTSSIQYTGPLTVSLPISIEAIAVAPGLAASPVASTSYTTILGTTAVTSALNPAVEGQSVTFTATVTPAAGTTIPSGSLQFSVNNVPLGPPMPVNSGGVATYSTSKLPEAYLSITASYVPSSGAPTTSATSPALIQAIYSSARQSSSVFFNNSVKPLGSGFSQPYGIAVDPHENVFIADAAKNAVYEILAASGYTTVNSLGGGFTFYNPTGVAVDANSNVFVADGGLNAIYRMQASDGYTSVTTLATGLNWPYGVAVDANENLYITDTGNHVVKMLAGPSWTGPITTIGSGFQYPWGVTADSSGNVFVTDVGTHRVSMISGISTGTPTVTPLGAQGFFSNPYGLAVDPNDNLFVSDTGYSAVREISLIDGWTTISTPGNGFYVPIGTAVDASEDIYIADTNNSAVKEVSLTGGNFGTVKTNTTSPYSISMNFFFDTATTLGSTAVVVGVGGASSTEFTDAGTGTCYPSTPYAGVSTCTVDVKFTPKATGPRSALVELLDSSGNVLAYGAVQGVGN